ncbi:MAG: Efflux transporter periplasmic adaptor subunit [Caulobacteraceae bacterium]|nr:Efflux transporter periplasmic adaptor subunit [Caulobacteraceae bacterium]
MSDTTVQRTPRPRGTASGYASLAASAVLSAVGAGLWGCDRQAAAASAAPPPEVTVAFPARGIITSRTEFTGQLSAVNQVTLLAQVSGYLREFHFKDGQIVHKGDLLFVIDPRPFEIQLQQANAQYQSASAALTLATKEVGRATQLTRAGAEAVEILDQSTQNQEAAAAAVKTAEAAIRAARLNLEFTRIVAPFTGRISMRRVSIGSLVNGASGTGQTPLTSIVSLDPIYVDFDMSEADYSAYQHSMAGRPAGSKTAVEISVDGEAAWSRTAQLDFLDNEIDRASGTMHARATLTNMDNALAPGQFARVRVPVSGAVPQLLIPDAAIGADQSAKTVLVVQSNGVAASRQIEIGPLEDHGMRVVTRGLSPTDRVVVNGLMRAHPGLRVAARLEPLSVPPKS